jgi:DNA repair protein RadC
MEKNDIVSLFSITEVELVYRNKLKPSDRRRVTDAQSAYDIFLNAWDMNKIELVEQFVILLLDRNNGCIGLSNISTGGISACLVDPKIVFATALKARSSALVLAHNHPSGNLKPSQADITLTEKLKDGGRLLDISILDHLIITPHNFHSFANEGPCYL